VLRVFLIFYVFLCLPVGYVVSDYSVWCFFSTGLLNSPRPPVILHLSCACVVLSRSPFCLHRLGWFPL